MSLNVTPEQVKGNVTTIMLVAQTIAKLTPTQVDDNIVASVNAVVSQDWFVNLVVAVMNSGLVGKPAELTKFVEKHLAK